MPVGNLKNRLYHAALPVLGRRCPWHDLRCDRQSGDTESLRRIWRRRRVVGGVLQRIRGGMLAERYTAGYARLTPPRVPVEPETYFRTASIAKLATALLVFRLQTLGMLEVGEDIGAFLGYPVRNPRFPGMPVTLGMLLSHTSSLVDSPAYFASFTRGTPLPELLADASAFSGDAPGARFRYSNLAAGLVACALEARFGRSFEALAQIHLFEPLHARASFDLTALKGASVADSYRVLPAGREPSFDAGRRLEAATPLDSPNPLRHYTLASGNLFLTGEALGRLLLPLLADEKAPDAFLSAESLTQMKSPLGKWPEKAVAMGHGMGLLSINDPKISGRVLYGHQGFAYGAVNGCFFSENGDGFVSLNSGASEERLGHISLLNRDLIRLFLP